MQVRWVLLLSVSEQHAKHVEVRADVRVYPTRGKLSPSVTVGYLQELSARSVQRRQCRGVLYVSLLARAELAYSMLIRRHRSFDVLMRTYLHHSHTHTTLWVFGFVCVCFSFLESGTEMLQMSCPFIPPSSFELRGSRGNLTFHCGLPQIKIELSCFSLKSLGFFFF